jgi:hypothetical protein
MQDLNEIKIVNFSEDELLFLDTKWSKLKQKLLQIKTECNFEARVRTGYKKLPDVEYLNECFEYNETTGILIRKTRPFNHFKTTRTANHINSRDVGTIAGVLTSSGYFRSRVGGSKYMNHRIIWKMMTGNDPEFEIDHINNVRHDNRWCNLREANSEQNARNCVKSEINTSGFKGVHWNENESRWTCQLGFKNKRINCGHFKTKELAFEIYKLASDFMFNEFKNYGECE